MKDIEIIAVIVLTILFCYFLFLTVAFFVRPKNQDDVWQDGDAGPNWGKDGK